MSRPDRVILDTSLVIDPPADLESFAAAAAVSTITLAGLAFGLHSSDPVENARRESVYRDVLDSYRPIPYSSGAARLYGALCASVRHEGRNPRPRRLDLLIASVAAELGVPLLTRNPRDFAGIQHAVQVVAVPA